MKELNETYFDETYAENRLKRFRIRNVRTEDVKEEKLDLTLIQRNVEKFKKKLKLLKKILKKSLKCWKENLIKLKNWRKINEMFMKSRKMLLCQLMKIMKLLKITSWIFTLIITSLKISLSLLKLKIKNCEMLHERKIFEINKSKKTFLTKIQKF